MAASLLSTQLFFKEAKYIACYLPFKDEFDTEAIIHEIWRADKRCYLPVLTAAEDNSLVFARYKQGDELQPNRYSILEPADSSHTISVEKLNVVLMPLVAFDCHGHRLGTGGGFYDRTFAFLKGPATKKPLMVGVGYAAQQSDAIPPDAWDIKMDMIVTEENLIFCS